LVAEAPRKVCIRGGVWRELFVILREGRKRQDALERELGRRVDYRDDAEYERAAKCYEYPTSKREIERDGFTETVEAVVPFLIEGRVGTGKTFSVATFLHLLCELFPGIRILVIRQTFESLAESFKATFEDDVLPKTHPFVNELAIDRGHRKSYNYPNGSRIVMRGFDRPGRTFSTEWDVIYFMEVTDEGTDKDSVEQLIRAMRGNRCPIKLFLMDCNPGAADHWANQGCLDGSFKRIVTTWKDNPAFWSVESNDFTFKGKQYVSQIKAVYTGVNYERNVLGLWKTAEGAILPNFEYGRNVLDLRVARDVEGKWRLLMPRGFPGGEVIDVDFFVGSLDFGFNAPGCLQIWAVDRSCRLYLIEEVYQSQRDVEWWADEINLMHKKYDLERVVCDSEDPASISLFNKRMGYANGHPSSLCVGISKTKGDAGMSFWRASVNLVNSMFAPERAPFMATARERGIERPPRIVLSMWSLSNAPDLVLKNGPKRTQEEFSGYVYRKRKPGEPIHEEPAKGVADHGIDALRYVAWWISRHYDPKRKRGRLAPPGSIGEVMGGFDQLEEEDW
jgi:hypothetical protein